LKKIIKTIILIALTVTAQQSFAQNLSAETAKVEIEKVIINNLPENIKNDAKVNIRGLRFTDLTLPDGEITYIQVKENDERFFPRTIKKINICVDGRIMQVVNVPVEIAVYKDVLVASEPINREQVLSRENTVTKKINVADRLEYYLTSEILRKEATSKKMFREGELIDKRFVKVKPDVVLNSEVRVFFVSNDAVMITIEATALSDGLLGEYIKVSNKKYNKTYTGKVIGENRVLVQI